MITRLRDDLGALSASSVLESLTLTMSISSRNMPMKGGVDARAQPLSTELQQVNLMRLPRGIYSIFHQRLYRLSGFL